MTFEAVRADFIRRTRRGVAFIGAAVVIWTVFAALGAVLPVSVRPFIYLFGAGTQFPAGILVSTLLKHDWQSKGNPLGLLGGLAGGLQILFAPIIIVTWAKHPEYLPGFLGVLVGAHFLTFFWLYNSRAYLFLSVAVTAVAAATGLIRPEWAYILTPAAVAVTLAAGVFMLHRENQQEEVRHAA